MEACFLPPAAKHLFEACWRPCIMLQANFRPPFLRVSNNLLISLFASHVSMFLSRAITRILIFSCSESASTEVAIFHLRFSLTARLGR